jgi:hypothetical protein
VIAHNGPLRTRIEGHLDGLEEFKAHVQRAQFLLSGWLVTLYHLMLVVVWNALVYAVLTVIRAKFTALLKESTAHRLIDLYGRDIRAGISYLDRRMAVAWFLPTLEVTWE